MRGEAYKEDIEEGAEAKLKEGLDKGADNGAPQDISLYSIRKALEALTAED